MYHVYRGFPEDGDPVAGRFRKAGQDAWQERCHGQGRGPVRTVCINVAEKADTISKYMEEFYYEEISYLFFVVFGDQCGVSGGRLWDRPPQKQDAADPGPGGNDGSGPGGDPGGGQPAKGGA